MGFMSREDRGILHRLHQLFSKIVTVVGMITLIVLCTPIVSWWARAYAGSIHQPKGDVLIVLAAAADDSDGISYSSYWRARTAALAWRAGGFKEVVVTGGGGPGIRDFLVAEGVPRSAIVAEWRSKSTRQNALNTVRIIHDVAGRRVLLTSDFHMYRAQRVFRKAGVDVVPMAVPDVLHAAEHWNGRFSGLETMAVETVKIGYYELRGWM